METVVAAAGREPRKHRKLLEPEGSHPHPDPETFARSYQLEALEKAMRENTIAFLETGSGKTLIAVMLLRAYTYMLRKPSEHIAVFLVPTVVLVSQQADVIEMHTDLKVGRFWGEMGVDFWNAATWKEQLNQFEVFVMTPQILLDNLRHSFFKLEKIKLLIFDECHNARGRSPYACIMTEFYHKKLRSSSVDLPRIFGMTASLINSKGSNSRIVYMKHILELESLMNSKVYTVASESVLAEYIAFSTTRIKQYKHVDIPYDLFLFLADSLKTSKFKYFRALQELKLDGSTEESAKKKISKLYATFLFCITELGIWLAAKAAESLACKENSIFFWGQRNDDIGERTVRKFSQEVFEILSRCLPTERCIGDDIRADVEAGIMTTKVQCLIQSLLDYRKINDLRCIIFVERVITAIVLQPLLCNIRKLSGWASKYMAGNRSGLQLQTRKEQIKIVDAFREGKVNIIVATQILEEGLDVQSCNLVIRFDPSATVCSFIQSRGRARMQGSDYVLIVKSGDKSTLSKVANYLNSGEIMREESLRQASLPCEPLENEMCHEEYYRVETTGATVTLSSSIALIYFYCSRLPSDGYFKPSPRFVIDKESNICTLHMPKSCPIQTVCKEGQSSMLKQIVCLEACKKLHKHGALTDYLLPVFDVESEDDVLESGVELYAEKQVNYFPGELVGSWSTFSFIGLYHCYKIAFNQSFDYDASFNDIILVVKCDLGSDFVCNSFSLDTDRGSVAVNMKYVGAIHLTAEQVTMAKKFQVGVLTMLIHHDLTKFKGTMDGLNQELSPTTFTYLLLPTIRYGCDSSIIDWDCVKSVLFPSQAAFSIDKVGNQEMKHHCSLKGVGRRIHTRDCALCSCRLQNSVVYTPHNGRFYCIVGFHDDLNGNSTIKLRGGEALTYKKYYESRHGLNLSWECESLLAARHLFTVQNFLLRRPFHKEKELGTAAVELPPELCVVIMSPISVNTLYSFSFVPSIMYRIQCLLLAVRIKEIQLDHCMQNATVPAVKILEAITTKKCREEFSLESLETLGDSFLKYAASQHLFRTNKHHHEGILSAKKDRVISNAALCRLGCGRNLPGFIRNEEFDPKQWTIPGDCFDYFGEDENFLSNAKDVYIRGTRYMKSKVVADTVEALVGAYLSTGGELVALYFLEWLGMKIDFNKDVVDGRPILARPEMYVNVKVLELLLRYTFRDPSLLVEALTHGSYQVQDTPRCYQRLEFLGDAVLDHLITVHLYKKYPGMSPGLLTDLRSASVNNDCYAHAAVKAGLNKHILHASSELHKQMTFYINNFAKSFSGSSYGWEAGVALPKVLGDIIESVAGAIFVDSGFNKEIVWQSIRPLLEPLVSPETVEIHPVRELNEICSRKSYGKTFSTTGQDGVASMTVEVEADGTVYKETRTGANRKTAKKIAAKAVLQSLKANISGL